MVAGSELPDLDELRDLLMRRPAWQAQAACKGEGVDVFFAMTIAGIAEGSGIE